MRTNEELERLIDQETEASEATRDLPAPPGGVRRRRTRAEVYSVRLTTEEIAEIQQIADEARIPASGLVRDWVRQGLKAECEDSLEQTVESLSRDVAQLRRQLASKQHRDRKSKQREKDKTGKREKVDA